MATRGRREKENCVVIKGQHEDPFSGDCIEYPVMVGTQPCTGDKVT